MLCAGVCERMDPTHVVLWICGWLEQHFGLANFVEDDLCDWKGNHQESDAVQVVDLDARCKWVDVRGVSYGCINMCKILDMSGCVPWSN